VVNDESLRQSIFYGFALSRLRYAPLRSAKEASLHFY
jgi:hypothetical protein